MNAINQSAESAETTVEMSEHIKWYQERFPKCKWVVELFHYDGSVDYGCPFGSSGELNQTEVSCDSNECYQCPYYNERTEERLTCHIQDWPKLAHAMGKIAVFEVPKKIEVLLYKHHIPEEKDIPEVLAKAINKNRKDMALRDRRGCVVDLFKTAPATANEMEFEKKLNELGLTGYIYRENGPIEYHLRSSECGELVCTIEKVDTTRKWTIETDGSGNEYIRYLDTIVFHDEETNYCKTEKEGK